MSASKAELLTWARSKTWLAEVYEVEKKDLEKARNHEYESKIDEQCQHNACRLSSYENGECYLHRLLSRDKLKKFEPQHKPLPKRKKKYYGVF